MYLETDFAGPQAIDRVTVETCPDDHGTQTEVQVLDDHGSWRQVGGRATEESVPMNGNIRKAAIYELRARNVNYLLIRDTDYGAEDLRDDPESWGLEEIAVGYGARLYRVAL